MKNFIVVLMCLFLFGCAGVQLTPQQETAAITIAARTVGYSVGMILPEHATDIQELCMMPYSEDPEIMRKNIVAALQKVWLSLDGRNVDFAVMSINDFVDLIGLTIIKPDAVMVERWKKSVAGFCQGVNMASPSVVVK